MTDVPSAAVEAGARAGYESMHRRAKAACTPWDRLTERYGVQAGWRDDVRAVLEAASERIECLDHFDLSKPCFLCGNSGFFFILRRD